MLTQNYMIQQQAANIGIKSFRNFCVWPNFHSTSLGLLKSFYLFIDKSKIDLRYLWHTRSLKFLIDWGSFGVGVKSFGKLRIDLFLVGIMNQGRQQHRFCVDERYFPWCELAKKPQQECFRLSGSKQCSARKQGACCSFIHFLPAFSATWAECGTGVTWQQNECCVDVTGAESWSCFLWVLHISR